MPQTSVDCAHVNENTLWHEQLRRQKKIFEYGKLTERGTSQSYYFICTILKYKSILQGRLTRKTTYTTRVME